MSAHAAAPDTVRTRIPARMDRLPWTRWHWRIIIALGAVWILDGLEVTIVGSIAARLQDKETLGLSAFQSTAQGSIYVAGACIGAIVFGVLTDKLGRKRLFLWTLSLYLLATVATAFTQDFWMFAICRFFTGMGIGGEYAAINSAIDELIPARVRGWADLVINGSFWIGTAMAAALSLLLLSDLLPKDLGWRLTFGAGALMALLILVVRRTLPESPRWLLTHGRAEEAEAIVGDIEGTVRREAGGGELPEPEGDELEVHQRTSIGFGAVARTLFQRYPRRMVLGLALMAAQAFAFNAVLFSFATVLTTFFNVGDSKVGLFLLPFALVNFLGPLTLGRFFDTVGRRPMIAGTYAIAGVLLAVSALLFNAGSLTAWSFVACLCAAFFFASAGASAGYLTVSEVFPMEIRAMAIAFFYAVATALGGITGPVLFAKLIESPGQLAAGFLVAAALMIIAAVVEVVLGIDAEGESLEDIAKPLTAEAAEGGDQGEDGARRERPAAPQRATAAARANRFTRPGWSPTAVASSRPRDDRDLDREVAAVVAALEGADGPVDRRTLAEQVGARRWGAGRFSMALGTATAQGHARRVGRGSYEAVRAPVES